MRAIVEINGKQYEIEEGRYVQVDLHPAAENEEVVIGNVRMIIAGEQSLIGAPYVEGAQVVTTVKRHGRGPKILVYKMRCKKGYRRKNGHRQGFTELQVVSVNFPGRESIAPKAQATVAPAKTEAKPKKAAGDSEAVEKPKAKKTTTAKTGTAKSAPSKKSAPKAETPEVGGTEENTVE